MNEKLELLKKLKEDIIMTSRTTYYAQVGTKVIVDVFKYSIKEVYRLNYQNRVYCYPDMEEFIPELEGHDNPCFNKKDFVQYEIDTLDKLIEEIEYESI